MAGRKSEIILFKAFTSSLERLCKNDEVLFTSKRPRVSLVHRLAIYLEQELGGGSYVDMMTTVKLSSGSSAPDILVHERNGCDYTLAIYTRDSYLSSADKEEAKAFHNDKNCLTLAFTLLPEKNYFLIYRFGNSYTDYLHISKEDFSESLLKRIDESGASSDSQLTLLVKTSKKSKS